MAQERKRRKSFMQSSSKNTLKADSQNSIPDEASNPPLILLSGDNARTASMLHQALLNEGFPIELAAPYQAMENVWREQRHPVVLLEVSGAHSVEDAVSAALSLKRIDPLQFVAYIADPVLHTAGLAGDAIFPRSSAKLAEALRRYLAGDPSAPGDGLASD
jgi:hypothetical protein